MAALLIPIGLAILMFAVGLETQLAAFRRLARVPALVGAGLATQVIGLPLLAIVTAKLFGLPPIHAVGLMLVAAAPVGVTSNFVTLMARGDVALSVVLTVVTSALAPLTVPIAAAVAFALFADESVRVALPVGSTVGAVFAVTVVPLLLGTLVAHRFATATAHFKPTARRISTAVFIVIVGAAIAAQGTRLLGDLLAVGPAALAYDLVGLVSLVALGRLVSGGGERTAALVLTGGLRNVAVALTIAVSLLGRPEMAAAATVYVVVMNAVALAFVGLRRRGLPEVKDA